MNFKIEDRRRFNVIQQTSDFIWDVMSVYTDAHTSYFSLKRRGKKCIENS